MMNPILRKSLKITGIAAAGLFWIWAVGFVLFLIGVTFTDAPKKLEYTDAIIVLTGGQNRVNTGLDLLMKGKADHLFISGVNPNVTIENLVRIWDPKFDYIPCCIALGYAANNTEGNARESSEWARAQNIKTIRLVTSNYHLPRAWLEFTHALPQHKIIAHPINPTSVEDDSKHFLKLSLGEYNKTVLTWVRLYIYPWNILAGSKAS